MRAWTTISNKKPQISSVEIIYCYKGKHGNANKVKCKIVCMYVCFSPTGESGDINPHRCLFSPSFDWLQDCTCFSSCVPSNPCVLYRMQLHNLHWTFTSFPKASRFKSYMHAHNAKSWPSPTYHFSYHILHHTWWNTSLGVLNKDYTPIFSPSFFFIYLLFITIITTIILLLLLSIK